MVGIYKITNPLGQIYIGASKDVEKRIAQYKRLHCRGQNKILQSLKDHGVDSHVFEIVETCSIEDMAIMENYHGTINNVLTSGLNDIIPDEYGKGLLFSESNIKNRSMAQLGKTASLNTIDKMSKSQLGRKHHSNTKDKMRLNNQNTKIVLNLNTGVFYHGTKEASESLGINRYTLKNKLNGQKQNNTPFVYV